MALNPSATDWTRPAQGGFSITPGPGLLVAPIRGINVAVEGTVTFVHADGSSTSPFLVAGVVHPVCALKVTDATATGLVGYY